MLAQTPCQGPTSTPIISKMGPGPSSALPPRVPRASYEGKEERSQRKIDEIHWYETEVLPCLDLESLSECLNGSIAKVRSLISRKRA